MSGINVGTVTVKVIPDAQGVGARLRRALLPDARRIAQEAGQVIGEEISDSLSDGLSRGGRRATVAGAQAGARVGRTVARQITGALNGAVADGIAAGGRRARSAALRQGEEAGGAFARSLKVRLEAAFKSLPKISVGADTSDADSDLQALRVRMESLSHQRIGIDISAEDAKAEIRALRAELTRLGAQHPNVAVRADTAAAMAHLQAVQTQIDAVDRDDATVAVHVDAAPAMAALRGVAMALAALSAIPVGGVALAGLGGLAAAATAAGAGIGALAAVAVPAFSQVAKGLQLQEAAQEAATQATENSARSAARARQHQLQLASAVRSVVAARRTAAQSVASANQQVTAAEQSLSRAQQVARRAQQDLTRARHDAVRQLQDLHNQLEDSRLSERAAALSVKQAKQDLDKTLADPTASRIQREQAQLTYDQAVQQLKEQRQQHRRLKQDTAAADRAGVEGSDAVVKARQQVVAANRAVTEAQQKIAQAQQRAADTQAQAAEHIASAQRQLAQAQLQTASSTSSAATAQAAYTRHLAEMTPAARALMGAVTGLKSAFNDLSAGLQPSVLPLITRPLKGLTGLLPKLSPLIGNAARALGGLENEAAAALKQPFWAEFGKNVRVSVGPALTSMGRTFGSVFTGIAGIINAFLPHMRQMGGAVESAAATFAKWGVNLGSSRGFTAFLDYVRQAAPTVKDTIVNLKNAIVRIAQAAAAPGLTALSGISLLLRVIGMMSPAQLQATALAVGAIVLATKAFQFGQIISGTIAWTAAQGGLNTALRANPIGAVLSAITLLVAAVIYAWHHFEWFRTAVTTCWHGIQAAAMWAWNTVLKPVFGAIVSGVRKVGQFFSWLYTNVIHPVWDLISAAFGLYWTYYLKPVLNALRTALRAVGAAFSWLWARIIRPVWSLVSTTIKIGWVVISAVFHVMVAVIRKSLGIAFQWLYRSVVRPVWNLIKTAISAAWHVVIRPVFNALKGGINAVGRVFTWLYSKVIHPVWNRVQGVIAFVWRKGISPVFTAMSRGIGLVAGSFRTAKDIISRTWGKVREAARSPIRWVVDNVYNKGVVSLWNKVAGWVGLGGKYHLSPFRPRALGFATGGVVPGYAPGHDAVPAVLSPGEGILRPEVVRQLGPDTIHQWNRNAMRHGHAFAKGGVVPGRGGAGNSWDWLGSIGHAISSAASSAWHGVTGSMSFIGKVASKGAAWVWDHMIKAPVTGLLGRFPGVGTWSEAAYRLPGKVLSGLLKSIFTKAAQKKADEMGGAGAASAIAAARSQIGVPYSWGGGGLNGPTRGIDQGAHTVGFDCSSLVRYAWYQAVKKAMPRTSQEQQAWTRPVGSPHPGDLVFYGHPAHHVGMVTGKNHMIEAPHTGALVNEHSGFRGPTGFGRVPWNTTGGGGTYRGTAQEIARAMLKERGWASQWAALDYIVSHESGWNTKAVNPSSGAYGLFQALPASKLAAAGGDWRTNPATQIRWGLGYIAGRYGDPNGARAFWQRHHWYDSGGYLAPGASLVANGTGRPEPVLTAHQWNTMHTLAERGMAAQSGVPRSGPVVNINEAGRAPSPHDIVRVMRAAERLYT